jgi:hypothetical protein
VVSLSNHLLFEICYLEFLFTAAGCQLFNPRLIPLPQAPFFFGAEEEDLSRASAPPSSDTHLQKTSAKG